MAIISPKVPHKIGALSGLSALAGTTVIAGTPDEVVAGRQVLLIESLNNTATLRRAVSDASGAWVFDSIASPREPGSYLTIAIDPTGVFDPVAKSHLIPTPMPPDPAEHPA